jgi:hypothetical protein
MSKQDMVSEEERNLVSDEDKRMVCFLIETSQETKVGSASRILFHLK